MRMRRDIELTDFDCKSVLSVEIFAELETIMHNTIS